MLRGKGYIRRYSHIATNSDPLAGCTKFRHRVDDLSGTTVFVWGLDDDSAVDCIQKSMMATQYTWVNGAECHAPCCVSI